MATAGLHTRTEAPGTRAVPAEQEAASMKTAALYVRALAAMMGATEREGTTTAAAATVSARAAAGARTARAGAYTRPLFSST